jgi:dCTP deaminase
VTASGILPRQRIIGLLETGAIVTPSPPVSGQIQPASLDLRLGPKAHRVRASFLPQPGSTVAEKLDELTLHTFSLSDGAVLETGCVYVVPLIERLALPKGLAAMTNPKSSTGRLDVFTRVIADGVAAFDTLPAGYTGPLYAEICPQTFPVLVRAGSRLSQIRFRQLASDGGEPATGPIEDLSVDLAGNFGATPGLVGYRARRHTAVVDVDKAGGHAVADYWEPIAAEGGRLILDPDQFYILASKEAVAIPPTHAAEMVPFNPLVGEFRVHYAGFFDPGFGHAAAGGTGARAVLEVRSHTVPFLLEHGQIIGRLVHEPLTELPDQIYGTGIGSHYQAQGLKLSKHFR